MITAECPALPALADGEIVTLVAPDGHLVDVMWGAGQGVPAVEVHSSECACGA